MNCQEALSLLYDIIDKEASEIDARQVEEHLEKCRDCFEKYRLETEIQNFLNEKFKANGSESVQESLRTSILDRLDEIDRSAAPNSRETRRPFRLPAIVAVAVASLVVLIGAGFYGVRFYTHQSRYLPLEQSHWTMAGTLDASAELSTQDLIDDARRSYGYELRSEVGGYRLAGGHSETVLDTDMLHYLYASGGSTVSVFLASSELYDAVADDNLDSVMRHQIHFYDHDCRGCRLVFHRMGRTMVITATTDRAVDLLDFVPGRTVI